jgi:hypothetical protein
MNNKSTKKINLIKELIMSKGFSLKNAAAETGVGYHLFQKVVRRAHYIGKNGCTHFYENRHVREKIAAWLGYPYELVWGPGSGFFLKKMIAEELDRQAKIKTNQKLQALGIV